MATLVLSAAGMALGGSIGGSVMGLPAGALGRAAGAVLGRVIDQRILGAGSAAVDTGRLDRFRLTGASEGAALPRVQGRMRIGGQVIWAGAVQDDATTSGGGKGGGAPATTTHGYSVSLALALCEGQIARVGRIWADGVEIAGSALTLRVYPGTETQLPDPAIVAALGADRAPAYRGTAYVVIEDLPLAHFGNRVPQFSFEVMRPSEPGTPADLADIARQVRGVALIPGTGEYALATTQVNLAAGFGDAVAINVNTPMGGSDLDVSLNALREELPACGSVSLVVSWFGDDLRCGDCRVQPLVEQRTVDGDPMPWRVAGVDRATAGLVPQRDGRPVYGGTPADAAVTEALAALRARGLRAMFYPFILMTQMPGNALPDPLTGEPGQPVLPWRGRIGLSRAAGQPGSPDRSAQAAAEVAAFMGLAQANDFTVAGGIVTYAGPADWGYRRFILHYAHLCAAAGGVDAFCIGSEMVALTQIRGPGDSFPAVAALRQLAAEVRAILGPGCRIGYAADWSEYHGYQPPGTADKHFHLDPLWADEAIDFIGIDNYMPLSDWRDGTDHADAGWGAIYNLDYLAGNVAGGEGYDWFYHSPEARAAQIRTPITDGDGEPFVWRVKDLAGWWSQDHHDRIDGQRVAEKSAWVPQSKPIWFTELGCAAIDKGSNQPNKFLDPKSSESQLPYHSSGRRDELMQMQYLRAIYRHYADPARNPVVDNPRYRGPMVDMDRAHVWCWDARPYPAFPAAGALWSDGANHARGHWLNGRAVSRTLAGVVAEICAAAGVTAVDVSRLYGVVRGYAPQDLTSARAQLQPLLLAYGLEVAERGGRLTFTHRDGIARRQLTPDQLAQGIEGAADVVQVRAPGAETPGRLQIAYVDADRDYAVAVAEDLAAAGQAGTVQRSEFPLALTGAEAAMIVARWTQEAAVARDGASFALPPSQADLAAGDVVTLPADAGAYRIDRIEEAGLRLVTATRVDPEVYQPADVTDQPLAGTPHRAAVPVVGLFLDLPLIRGDEVAHAPHFAASARHWPGAVAVHGAAQDHDYVLQHIQRARCTIGRLVAPLAAGRSGLWDRQVLQVRLISGALRAVDPAAVLAGAHVLALGSGDPDDWEVLQFAQAQLVAPETYALTDLLRGQRGTTDRIRAVWPAGSIVVVLDGRPAQIALPTAARGLDRHLRYGPAGRPLGDATYRHVVHAFAGNGLRPYPVVHLALRAAGPDRVVSWIRQTRIDGDPWGQAEVPLGEEREAYLVQVLQGDAVRRAVEVSAPQWTYAAAERAADGTLLADCDVAVAQISARYGPGPATRLRIGA